MIYSPYDVQARYGKQRDTEWKGYQVHLTECCAETALAESEAWLRAVADTVPSMLFTTSPEGQGEYVSRSYSGYTGLSAGELLGSGWSQAVHPEDIDRVQANRRKALAAGKPWTNEMRLRRHDGVYRWFIGRARPMRDDSGQIVRWFGSVTDIEDQKQVEAALRSVNEDLNQFACAAAHDLREPLRNIRSYSELLVRHYAQTTNVRADRIKNVISESVERMEALLADLLEYTQLGADHEGEEWTDSRAAANKALQQLHATVASSQARISCGQLPVVPGRESHYVQLFQNLISNAIKYRGEQIPTISISAHKRENDWLFSVRDNGIGIDPQYSKLIFGVFKRLHGKNIPGTGIGLAICQKIVERYGGRIWVESEVGRGADFQLTIPHLNKIKI